MGTLRSIMRESGLRQQHTQHAAMAAMAAAGSVDVCRCHKQVGLFLGFFVVPVYLLGPALHEWALALLLCLRGYDLVIKFSKNQKRTTGGTGRGFL